MFSEDILVKIYSHKSVKDIPINYLSTVTHTVEEILEDMGYDFQFQQTWRNDSNSN